MLSLGFLVCLPLPLLSVLKSKLPETFLNFTISYKLYKTIQHKYLIRISSSIVCLATVLYFYIGTIQLISN